MIFSFIFSMITLLLFSYRVTPEATVLWNLAWSQNWRCNWKVSHRSTTYSWLEPTETNHSTSYFVFYKYDW